MSRTHGSTVELVPSYGQASSRTAKSDVLNVTSLWANVQGNHAPDFRYRVVVLLQRFSCTVSVIFPLSPIDWFLGEASGCFARCERNSTIRVLNSSGYGGRILGMVDFDQ